MVEKKHKTGIDRKSLFISLLFSKQHKKNSGKNYNGALCQVILLTSFLILLTGFISVTADEPTGGSDTFFSPINMDFFSGKVILVDDGFTDEPENHKWNTINNGLLDAEDGDIIYVYQGNYDGPLNIDKKICLMGEKEGKVNINGWGHHEVITIHSPWVKIGGITLYNGHIGIKTHTHTDISNIEIRNCHYGIYLTNSSSIYMENLNIHHCFSGLHSWNTSYTTLFNSTVHDTDWGFYITMSNTITINKSVFHNIENKTILTEHASQIRVSNCESYQSFCGIAFRNSFNNYIHNCTLHDNHFGIRLFNSTHNIITNSTLSTNNIYAIYIQEESQHNLIHHNNFMENTDTIFPTHCLDAGQNYWHAELLDEGTYTYQSIGNYWDDYLGPDADKNGIGDIPHNISGGYNKDEYPLINLVGWPVSYFDFNPYASLTTDTTIHFTEECIDLDGTIDSWYWDFGDGITSTEQHPAHRYSDNGNYTVTLLTIDNDGFIDSCSVNVPINNMPPQANYTLNKNGYTVTGDASFSHDSDGTIITYRWDWGDGTITSGPISSHTFLKDGIYNITLTITDDDGDTDHLLKEIFFRAPIPNFSYNPTNPTALTSLLFIDESYSHNGNLVTWLWEFGDGASSMESNPEHTYFHDGIYHVNLTILDEKNLSATISQSIVILNNAPTANFTFIPLSPADNEIIEFIDLSFDRDGEISKWVWDFGDGNGSDEQYPLHQYSDDGSYIVNLTIYDDDFSYDVFTTIITVKNNPPEANFHYSPIDVSEIDLVHFTDKSNDWGNIINWTWSFGDGTLFYGANPTHQYQESGIYPVKLTVRDDDGAMDAATKNITVHNIKPIGEFTWNPQNPTTSQLVIFDATSSLDFDDDIISYEWDWDDDNQYDEETQGSTVSNAWPDNGQYIVTLRVTDTKGAIGIRKMAITVANTPPFAKFDYLPINPEPASVINFTSHSNDTDGLIRSYNWSFGDGGYSTQKHPQHIYLKNDVYTVTLTVTDDDGAFSTQRKNINVNSVPVADFIFQPAQPTILDNITFYDKSEDTDGVILTYSWDLGDGTILNDRNISHRYSGKGNFTVTLSVRDDNGAITNISYIIHVKSIKPLANFVFDSEPKVDVNTIINFWDTSVDNDGEIVNWTWDFDDGTRSYGNNTSHAFTDNGEYYVMLTVIDDDGNKNFYGVLFNVAGGNEEENGIPGFESIILIFVLSSIVLLKKKRYG